MKQLAELRGLLQKLRRGELLDDDSAVEHLVVEVLEKLDERLNRLEQDATAPSFAALRETEERDRAKLARFETFRNAVAYELGVERNPDLAFDALRALLKRYRALVQFLGDVTAALGDPALVPGEAEPEEVLRKIQGLLWFPAA